VNTIRILVADDHAVLRSGLALLLSGQPDMVVVGEAADGVELLILAEETQPDIILLDLTMPLLGGLDVLPLLRKHNPNARVLILTMHDDESYLRQALKQGASGYVLKKAADIELLTAIRAVLRGDVYVHTTMTRAMLDGMIDKSIPAAAEEDAWDTLSQREKEVLKLVAMGHTGRAIANQLSLSIKTIETYRARGMDKLSLRNRAALVRFALARGLME